MAQELLARFDRVINHMEKPGADVPKDECFAIIQEVSKEWGSADTELKRVALLEILKCTYDLLQTTMYGEDVKGFAEYRDKLYKVLLMTEVMIGTNVSTSRLDAVTKREVLAGRMQEDHELRKLALMASAAPYLTDEQLYAKNAPEKKEASRPGFLSKVKSLFE
jgi:hypothetical protein